MPDTDASNDVDAWLWQNALRPAPDSLPGHSVPFVEDVGASHAGSLDALLGTASPGNFVIDLRGVPQAGEVAERFASTISTMNGPNTQLVDPLVGFDAAYFVNEISPWHTWIDAAGLTEEPAPQ